MKRPRLLFILGTRPEAIKCAPVILKCQEDPELDVRILTTSQHRELQDNVLEFFGISSDHDLNLMREKPDLTRLVSDAWLGLSEYLKVTRPDLILVQGDTTTAFIAALAAFYHKIPIAHIEAGLRTYDRHMPFPEEGNRRLITHIADLHFAPTKWAADNLRKENIPDESIYVVGNSGIDALFLTQERLQSSSTSIDLPVLDPAEKLMLVTSHRRENWGENLHRICLALKELAGAHSNVRIVFLTHPNPEVSSLVRNALHGVPRIEVRHSVIYPVMVHLLHHAHVVLTDSGGLQEEAPALGKPVLVLREKTERPEAVEQECARLVGTDPQVIVRESERALRMEQRQSPYSPYGDGHAASRIRQAIRHYFSMDERPVEFQPMAYAKS